MKRLLLPVLGIFVLYAYFVSIVNLKNKVVLLDGEQYKFNTCPFVEVIETSSVISGAGENYNIELKLFGKVNLKTIEVVKLDNVEVIPCGDVIGMKLYTNGVLVVGMSEIESIDGAKVKPYENVDIKEGDTVFEINNVEIDSIVTLKKVVAASNGEVLNLKFFRDGEIYSAAIKPVLGNNNEYKIGLWVRDAATGVGTLTFYEPNKQLFGALGHGISDSDTNKLIDIDSGELVSAKILSIIKGKSGNAGELRGTILNQTTIGNVNKNSEFGIFGKLNNVTGLNINYLNKMKVALRSEIHEGDAEIYCNVDGVKVSKYNVKVEKIYKDNNDDNKSFMIRVVDKNLIDKTGGIIRGLSGAPIVQENKLIGAVTNVLVSNPEVGYGVFADLMIKQMVEE